MKSCIYRGQVSHERRMPVQNGFRYSVFMMYADLDDIEAALDPYWLWSARRPAPAWFRRADHGPKSPDSKGGPGELKSSICDLVEKETGRRPAGPVRLLTNFRYFGYCFNPISIYYCFDPDERLRDIVLEVSNTPWGERHLYVLGAEQNTARQGYRFEFRKRLHVSPFMDMDMRYSARLTEPGDRLYVGIDNRKNQQKMFGASLALERVPIGSASLARALATDPFITLRVMALIHWQAAKLWLKKVPYVPHPGSAEQPAEIHSPIHGERTRHD